MSVKEFFWNKVLQRPYRLTIPIDVGKGQPVILLHGLAGKALDWQSAINQIDLSKNRVIAFDLLGFGDSPKPDWKDYDVDDHAKSVLAAINKIGIKKPIVLVGHSMGAVIAARIVRLEPIKVKRLILYEIPVYANSPDQKVYDIRHKAYMSVFTNAIKNPARTLKIFRFLGRVASNFINLSLDEKSWLSFEKSLTNTVLKDTVYKDLLSTEIPVNVIYGRYDMIVLKRSMKKLFKKSSNVKFIQVNEAHRITSKTGKILQILISETI